MTPDITIAVHALATKVMHKPHAGFDGAMVVGNVEFFVGSMHAVVGPCKAHQDCGYAQRLLNHVDDRDRAARA